MDNLFNSAKKSGGISQLSGRASRINEQDITPNDQEASAEFLGLNSGISSKLSSKDTLAALRKSSVINNFLEKIGGFSQSNNSKQEK